MIAAVAPALTLHTRLLAGVLAAVFLFFILELIRRHRLQERYTILWLGASTLVIVVAIFPGLLALPNRLLGVRTPVVALVFLILLALTAVLLHLMVVISRQGEQITRLAQELALESARHQKPQPTPHRPDLS
jgi:hypothetical protein